MRKKLLLLPALLLISLTLPAQDTLRIMSYNVLNYSGTNAHKGRHADLKKILAYARPDVVVCSEVTDAAGAELLLDSAFNKAGIGTWSRATFINGPDTDNMLYYNNQKIRFASQHQIPTDLRDISHYRVYYLITPTDTAWMNLFSLHLKASSGFENDRLLECKDLCTYMGSNVSANENIIVGGDFNFYGNVSEPGFGWLTSTSCARRLYDPINRVGEWNNNATFKDVHTQSTRVNNEPDGGSTGGMDDRFDFVFTNNRVLDGTARLKYIAGSYHAIGNDANHFNKAVNAAPANTAVPAAIADALYNMSDHLPVIMEVSVGLEVGLSEYENNLAGTNVIWISMGLSGDAPGFSVVSNQQQNLDLAVCDMAGKIVYTQKVQLSEGQNLVRLDKITLAKGQYLLKLQSKTGATGCKFIQF